MVKVSKESVNYREGSSRQHCGNCVMYRDRRCDLVNGVISPDDVCDRWEAIVSKSEDLEMDQVRLSKMADQYNWMSIKMNEMLPVDPVTANKYAATIWAIKIESFPMLVKLHDAGVKVEPERFGWSAAQLVSEPMRKWLIKSEDTARVSTEHHPLGTHGLWHTPSKKVPEKQQLPAYFQNTARALMRDHGMDESQAIATAINAVKAWAEGKAFGGKVKVTPEVQRAARAALDEWAKLKESHKG